MTNAEKTKLVKIGRAIHKVWQLTSVSGDGSEWNATIKLWVEYLWYVFMDSFPELIEDAEKEAENE